MTEPLVVHGGVGGLAARTEDMLACAALLAAAAARLAGLAARAHRHLADPDLVASAALAPVSAGRIRAMLIAALDGPSGVLDAAGRLAVTSAALRAAAARYRATEEVVASLSAAAARTLGMAAGVTVTAWGLPVVTVGLAALRHEPAGRTVDRLLVRHPVAVDVLAGAVPGFLAGLAVSPGPWSSLVRLGAWRATGRPHPPRDLAGSARLLAAAFPDGRPRLQELGRSPAPAPSGLAGLLDQVVDVQGTDEISVRRVTGVDGAAWVVALPGTAHWDSLPFRVDPDVRDLGTTVHAVAGTTTTYERAVRLALARSGARPDEPVLLVGHSQGGLVAARTAAGMSREGRTGIHVVSVGAPVGHVRLPAAVTVLALEHVADAVPRMDATPPPQAVHRTTVVSHAAVATAAQAHDLQTYVSTAQAVDAAQSAGHAGASLDTALRTLAPFTSGVTSEVVSWRMGRVPGGG